MVEVITTRNLSSNVGNEPMIRSLSIMSIEDVFTEEGWVEDLSSNFDAYKKVALVRSCINILAHFSTQKGFRTVIEPHDDTVKKYVDGVNKRVNMDNALSLGIIRREIDGRAGFEMVNDGNNNYVMLLPLVSTKLKPEINKKTFQIDWFKYTGAEGGKYDVDDILYFTLNALKSDQLGMSAIDAIRIVLKLKRNLEKDLLEASKRLWAPVGLYEIDTSQIIDPSKKQERMDLFKSEIKPGQSIVHNQKVKSKILDLRPDINGLVRAIEKADEEIMGNWSIPKTLLSREKTVTKATLEYSLKALYDGPIASIQRYFRRELERQWYPRVLASAKRDWENRFEVKHIFTPLAIADPQLIMSIVRAVDAGILDKEDFFNIIGWDMEEAEGTKLPEEPQPEPPKPREGEPIAGEIGGA